LGYDVLATDIPAVVRAVLSQNIQANTVHMSSSGCGTVQVRELDWSVPPSEWTWSDAKAIAATAETNLNPKIKLTPPPQANAPPTSTVTRALASESGGDGGNDPICPPFDLIISADTIYDPVLSSYLLRTIHALVTLSVSSSPRNVVPPVYLCLERRDPSLVDQTLKQAEEIWNFKVGSVPKKSLVKAMEKGGVKWEDHDWEDVEVWKLTWTGAKASKTI